MIRTTKTRTVLSSNKITVGDLFVYEPGPPDVVTKVKTIREYNQARELFCENGVRYWVPRGYFAIVYR